eukprot:3937204-Rhodomonas_salina.1
MSLSVSPHLHRPPSPSASASHPFLCSLPSNRSCLWPSPGQVKRERHRLSPRSQTHTLLPSLLPSSRQPLCAPSRGRRGRRGRGSGESLWLRLRATERKSVPDIASQVARNGERGREEQEVAKPRDLFCSQHCMRSAPDVNVNNHQGKRGDEYPGCLSREESAGQGRSRRAETKKRCEREGCRKSEPKHQTSGSEQEEADENGDVGVGELRERRATVEPLDAGVAKRMGLDEWCGEEWKGAYGSCFGTGDLPRLPKRVRCKRLAGADGRLCFLPRSTLRPHAVFTSSSALRSAL